MRQRNDSLNTLFVQAADPPFEIAPGEIVDHDTVIMGMTVVEDLPQEDVKPVKKAATKAVAANSEEPAE
jgi:hypothetical protein